MNKKILDVTVAFLFCICLIVTANFQEEEEYTAAEENNSVAAGVSRVLSMYSFTTESDEEAGVTKNVNYRVAAQEEIEMQEAAGEAKLEAPGVEEPENKMELGEKIRKLEDTPQAAYQNRWNLTLTEEEINLLAKIVWLEASGESVFGQEAVVEVIFNRMASEEFPNTLYDVLSQRDPVQFCSWKNREIAKPTEKEYQSIYQVLYGNTHILRNDTLYFSTEPLTSSLDVEIGGHSFCY